MPTPDSVYRVRVSRLTASEATPPGSKSLTNRALILAALAKGESILSGALDAEDVDVMFDSLRALGVEATRDKTRRIIRVQGVDGAFPKQSAELYVGNSGTTARFLTAALAFSETGIYKIDGKPRMRERPAGDLIRALQDLGRDVRALLDNERVPLEIRGKATDDGEPIVCKIAANASSQFLSGLLMAAPTFKREMTVEIDGELASRPYVEMTLAVMRAFGVDVEASADFRRFSGFRRGRYLGREYQIEPDASAASYFVALPAILGGEITIRGLSKNSLQGDVGFVDLLERMGCEVRREDNATTVARSLDAPLRGIDADMNAIPDVAQTLAVVALFADSPTSIRNVANMRLKETDRLAAAATELRKLGAKVEERPDGLTVDPTKRELNGASIATYDDHRMAMSFALAGLRIPGVVIENPECVAKTYPEFFADLERATSPV